MDEEDQKDIIKKIKSSGDEGKDVNVDVNVDTGDDEEANMGDDEVDVDSETEEPLDEAGDLGFQPGNADKSYFANDARFAPGAENQMWESDDLLSDNVVAFGDDFEVHENNDNQGGEELKNGMIIEYFNNNKWNELPVNNLDTQYDKMFKLLMKYDKLRIECK